MPILFIYKPELQQIELISSCKDQNFDKYMEDLDNIIDGFLVKTYKIYIGNIFLAHYNRYAKRNHKSSMHSKQALANFENQLPEEQNNLFDGSSDLTRDPIPLSPSDYIVKQYAFKLLKPMLKDLQNSYPSLTFIEDQDPYISFKGKIEDFVKIGKEI